MAFLVNSPEFSTVSAKIFSSPSPNPKVPKSLSFSQSDDKVGASARVCMSLKDLFGSVSSDFDTNEMLYGQYSAAVKQESKQRKEEEEKQNYYVNMGDAIRTLREDFPDLFYRELGFDIYREDIVFKDPLNTFMGIENYKSIFWALRFNGRIFFKALWVDILSIWQPMENTIMVRWTVHGIPRVPWESRGRFDATSEYKLDKNGKIYEHRVHNIALNSPPKFQVLTVGELIQAVGCPSTPKPTFFEVSSFPPSSSNRKKCWKFSPQIPTDLGLSLELEQNRVCPKAAWIGYGN